MLLYNIFGCVLAFLITAGCIKLLNPIALRLGLVDLPGGRKQHALQTPLLGGIAMFLGFTFALLALPISLIGYRPFASASLLLVIVGLLDDMHEVTARTRIIVEVLAALIMALLGQLSLRHLGNLFFLGDIQLVWLTIPVTILATVGTINSINMLDGNDGLAGSIVLTQIFLLCLLCLASHNYTDSYVLLFLICSLIAFLIFNFPFFGREKAQVFMGDTGTMFLGFVITWFSISLSQGPKAVAPPITFLWIMALPIWDAARVIFLRLLNRNSPFKPDRLHLHHLLMARGFSSTQITLIMTFLTLSLGLVGFLGMSWHLPEGVMFYGFITGFAIYCYGVRTIDVVIQTC